MNLVIFNSKYGYTQKYAQWIAEDLGCTCINLKDITSQDIEAADTIILGSSVYAGRYKGLDRFSEWIENYPNKNYFFFSVSIADPTQADSHNYLLGTIQKALGEDLKDSVKVFMFRGGMDYSRMSLIHRLMMWVMVRSLKKKAEKTVEDQAMIANYGKQIDFSSKESIQPLLDQIKSL